MLSRSFGSDYCTLPPIFEAPFSPGPAEATGEMTAFQASASASVSTSNSANTSVQQSPTGPMMAAMPQQPLDSPTIQLEVALDMLCPWCYIGKRNLDRAIEMYRVIEPDVVFEVTWRPFYLFPSIKRTGHPKAALYDHLTPDTRSRVLQEGSRAGIRFKLSSGTTGHSRPAHKLLRLASRQQPAPSPLLFLPTPVHSGAVAPAAAPHTTSPPSSRAAYSSQNTQFTSSPPPIVSFLAPPTPTPSPTLACPPSPSYDPASTQSRLLDALFAAHFEHGADIGSVETLLALAQRAGIPPHEAKAVLDSEAETQETDSLEWESKRPFKSFGMALGRGICSGEGIKAVPTVTVQKFLRVGGMQSAEVLVDVFKRARGKDKSREQGIATAAMALAAVSSAASATIQAPSARMNTTAPVRETLTPPGFSSGPSFRLSPALSPGLGQSIGRKREREMDDDREENIGRGSKRLWSTDTSLPRPVTLPIPLPSPKSGLGMADYPGAGRALPGMMMLDRGRDLWLQGVLDGGAR